MLNMRLRTDHRSEPYGGSLGTYLLNGYLHKQDWTPSGPMPLYDQPYETARTSSGHWVHVEGGKPAMKRGYLSALSGFPWQAVRLAVEMVKERDPEAIAALEYYQLPAARRPSRYVWANSQGIDEGTISKRFKSAIRQIQAHLAYARSEWESGA